MLRFFIIVELIESAGGVRALTELRARTPRKESGRFLVLFVHKYDPGI